MIEVDDHFILLFSDDLSLLYIALCAEVFQDNIVCKQKLGCQKKMNERNISRVINLVALRFMRDLFTLIVKKNLSHL